MDYLPHMLSSLSISSNSSSDAVLANFRFFSSSDDAHSEVEMSSKPSAPRYLNTPKYPGTSVPRPNYVPHRRRSSSLHGERMRNPKVFSSFPPIPDGTPPSSPPKEAEKQKTVSPACLSLTKILTKEQPPAALKGKPTASLASPTSARLAYFSRLAAKAHEEIEAIDLRPDMLPNSPSRYVYNSRETPPTSPDTDSDEEAYGFFFSIVSQGPNHARSSSTAKPNTSSASGRQRKAQMAQESRLTFHGTMSQKASNPGKSVANEEVQPSWRRQSARPTEAPQRRRNRNRDPHAPAPKPGTVLSEAEEDHLRRTQPKVYKEYVRAQVAARFAAADKARALEAAELRAQGKMSFQELCENAEALLQRRGWLFNPASVVDASNVTAGEPSGLARRLTLGANLRRVLERGVARRTRTAPQ